MQVRSWKDRSLSDLDLVIDRIVQQMKEQLEVAHQDLATAANDQQKSRVELNDLRATIKRLEEEIELRILKSIHEITIKGLKKLVFIFVA